MPIDDAARDRVIAALQRSRASGYLDDAGLKQRVEIALATNDPYQLNNLLADLPGLGAYTWTPSPDQQLAPVSQPPTQQPKQWQEFLRRYWGVLLGMALVLLVVVGNGYSSFWWVFILVAFVFPRGMRNRKPDPQTPPSGPYQGFHPGPTQHHHADPYLADPYGQNPAAPPEASDQFDSDDGSGPSRWNQPPPAGKA